MPKLFYVLPRIRQHGTDWCIPAGIENMLRCIGYNKLTQEDLILNVVRSRENISNNKSDHEILEYYRCKPLPNATFHTFRDVAERRIGNSLAGWKFEVMEDKSSDKAKYLSDIKKAISADEPILISYRNERGNYHTNMVYEYNDSVLSLYDPGEHMDVQRNAFEYAFSEDLLVLHRVLISKNGVDTTTTHADSA